MRSMTAIDFRTTRRGFVRGSAGLLALASAPWLSATASAQGLAKSLVIDLDGELESIHPSLAYSGRDWSIVNSV
jgi:hypothetical protein